ncbi:transposase [Sphingomonas sp. NPDC079357]|jgi:transposase|uniref:transposase n=1 Tax=Sphingomonas sp. NPDC079357 TaxID=3364518 RepID=UPI00384B8355
MPLRQAIYDRLGPAVVAKASVPGVTVRELSQRLGIAESLIYNWRSTQRKAASIASPRRRHAFDRRQCGCSILRYMNCA